MSSSPAVHLVFPRSRGEISGGHIYNERLAEGLAGRGALSALSVNRLAAELERGTPGFFLLDSADLDHSEALPELKPQQGLGLIAHHLPSLDCFGVEATEARAAAQERERKLLARFDLLIATGSYAVDYLSSLGVPASRIQLIPPASPRRVATVSRPTAPPVRALLVGNVIPRKGVRELLEALVSELTDEHALELTIVGRLDLDAAYAADCAAFVAATPLSRVVRMLGVVPPEEVGAHYQKSHVFVSASRMETFGMALQEARSFGLPILAIDAGNVAEHVSEETGRLFTSITSLTRALLELVQAPKDVSLWLRRSESAGLKTSDDWLAAADAVLEACARAASLRSVGPC